MSQQHSNIFFPTLGNSSKPVFGTTAGPPATSFPMSNPMKNTNPFLPKTDPIPDHNPNLPKTPAKSLFNFQSASFTPTSHNFPFTPTPPPSQPSQPEITKPSQQNTPIFGQPSTQFSFTPHPSFSKPSELDPPICDPSTQQFIFTPPPSNTSQPSHNSHINSSPTQQTLATLQASIDAMSKKIDATEKFVIRYQVVCGIHSHPLTEVHKDELGPSYSSHSFLCNHCKKTPSDSTERHYHCTICTVDPIIGGTDFCHSCVTSYLASDIQRS